MTKDVELKGERDTSGREESRYRLAPVERVGGKGRRKREPTAKEGSILTRSNDSRSGLLLGRVGTAAPSRAIPAVGRAHRGRRLVLAVVTVLGGRILTSPRDGQRG